MKYLFRLANMVVVALSESPLHRLYSHQVIVLRFTGRRSGRGYAIPVSYLLCNDDGRHLIHCMTHVQGVWWKNLLDAGDIDVTWKGQRCRMSARVETEDTGVIEQALDRFCRASIVSAFFSGVRMVKGVPDSHTLREAAAAHVLIQLRPYERS